MSAVEDEETSFVLPRACRSARPRRLRAILAVLTAQYTMVAIIVILAVAGVLRYLVTPQIVAKFELIAAALKR